MPPGPVEEVSFPNSAGPKPNRTNPRFIHPRTSAECVNGIEKTKKKVKRATSCWPTAFVVGSCCTANRFHMVAGLHEMLKLLPSSCEFSSLFILCFCPATNNSARPCTKKGEPPAIAGPNPGKRRTSSQLTHRRERAATCGWMERSSEPCPGFGLRFAENARGVRSRSTAGVGRQGKFAETKRLSSQAGSNVFGITVQAGVQRGPPAQQRMIGGGDGIKWDILARDA